MQRNFYSILLRIFKRDFKSTAILVNFFKHFAHELLIKYFLFQGQNTRVVQQELRTHLLPLPIPHPLGLQARSRWTREQGLRADHNIYSRGDRCLSQN